ncbi:MAG: DUF6769 family protein [Tidjanibacter sp.]|nr:DUF6769 family protein [Tidjanibacter sp.]
MMKRIMSILGIGVATVAILLLTAIPHHHHGEQICFAVEHCESHQSCSHDNSCDHSCSHDENACMLSHGHYLVEDENSGIRIVPNATDLHLVAEPVELCPSTLLAPPESKTALYGEAAASEYSVEILYGCGLRAPPIS